ncbi:META domain-containing protein [Vitreoscilla massiliensis]|uniref:META domain-containing protein n=1 Tax=Vitreoscilla massiliensis TaxID=1689272 RepID=A0ABY4E098_9NEIS|nr:META domain-containing protein [Vitreoscilla massiliensis]UOO88982.1 META domain-containing protein [Vitreoscilla massiliensis]
MVKQGVSVMVAVLMTVALSACQTQQTPNDNVQPELPLAQIAAKGEWSLYALSAPNRFDTSQLRYRISLRIQTQEFSVAAPCARLLGHYRATAQDLRFRRIEIRDMTCLEADDASLLQHALQQTRFYRLQADQMLWLDQNHDLVAIWDRIYL